MQPQFQTYLSSHHIQKGQAHTHTRIGSRTQNYWRNL